jgi:glycerol-3-phosphate O-acyltransferase
VKSTDLGRRQLPVLAGLVASYLETYAVALRAAAANPGATAKDLTPKMHSLGERALLLGEIARTEALSRPMFETAYEYLKEVGALDAKGVVAVEADLLAVAMPLPTGRAPTVPPPPRVQQA